MVSTVGGVGSAVELAPAGWAVSKGPRWTGLDGQWGRGFLVPRRGRVYKYMEVIRSDITYIVMISPYIHIRHGIMLLFVRESSGYLGHAVCNSALSHVSKGEVCLWEPSRVIN